MMHNSINFQAKKILMLPNKVVHFYLITILIFFIFGPWEWRTANSFWLYSFLIISQLMLLLGYVSAFNCSKIKEVLCNEEIWKKKVLKYLRFAISINLVFVILYMMHTIGMANFSWNVLLNKIYLGIVNPLAQYQNNLEAVKTGSLLTKLITTFSPFLWPVLPLSLFYFKFLGRINKILVLFTIFFECAHWVAIGTNKGVIDIILTIISILVIKNLQNRFMRLTIIKKNPQKRKGIYVISGILLFIGIMFFANNIGDRVRGNWSMISHLNNDTEINFNSPLMKITPEFAKPIVIYVTSYLTQGYYGLSLALDKPFKPMFGVGNSVFLIENLNELFNIDLYQYTYQVRIADMGWHPTVNWHSFYLWVANDIPFILIPFLMFLLGKYFGTISYDSIAKRNPIASTLLCMLFILFFYLPCNNQIFSSPITFMAFWFLSAFWLYTRRIGSLKKQVNGK